ncbi:iq calmodulin-binding motif family protein [Stylonychia lemnae]|uniref:Iq calmodulin-binding motif family protein n=1 Tax=Stylonychia lemnae TaxID=5949 RepID=A0A077ZNK1_STYLE|nr:iq calmodulin-binding motif family protein [Stylonychia lemnae]|eukprot:CDW71493.1 iq calmodulin-binding motif family protein [Stylonychia lemnae]
MNIGSNLKQKQQPPQFSTTLQSGIRPGQLITSMNGLPSPNPLTNPQLMLNTAKSMSSAQLNFGGTTSKNATKVFEYEQSADKMHGTISGAYDIQPQYSVHSPLRNNENRRDYLNQQFTNNTNISTGNPMSLQGESAVRGRRLGGKELDVVCSIGSQDAFNIELLNSYNSQGFEYLSNQLGLQVRDRSEHSKDGKSSGTNNNAFKTRKGSTDSQARQGRFNSHGRSDKKRGKSSSNSQSRSKNPHDQRIAGLNYQALNPSKNPTHTLSSTMKRPNSASTKNLKKTTSMANIQNGPKNMVTSPTQANLIRDVSTNLLPPKNPKPNRNQTYAKLPGNINQPVGAHPLTGQSQSSVSNSTSNKRAPSSSLERKSNLGNSKSNFNTHSQELATFSPVRKNLIDFNTQPTSNHKIINSGGKNQMSRKKNKLKQQSNTKVKSPVGHIYTSDTQNLQMLSPNIGRIKLDQIINEENKEDSFNRQPLSSFDTSDLKIHHDNPNFGLSQNHHIMSGQQFDSQDSSLSIRIQNNNQATHQRIMQSDPKIHEEIQKQLYQHILEEDKKKKKAMNLRKNKENVEKLLQSNDLQLQQQRKLNNKEHIKQMMEQQLQKLSLAKKLKKPLPTNPVVDQQQKEYVKKEQEQQKIKRQQSREQYHKQREELQEIRVMMQDTLKQPLKTSSSNSQTRKRTDLSKSQQRPFSAKVGGDQTQQLLIKVPPVHIESSPYDPVYHQQQPNPHTETSPLKSNKYDHNKASMASGVTLSEQNQKIYDQMKPEIAEFVKKQKRERSKKRKMEEEQEINQIQSKAIGLQLLRQKCEKGLDNLKSSHQLGLNRKIRKSQKNLKSQKTLDSVKDPNILRKAMQARSKSKKRIDDEKENRRLSISPGKQHSQQLNSKEGRSGTKSRSDKKRKQKQLHNMMSEAQLHNMQLNVMELLQQQNPPSQQAHKTLRTSGEAKTKLGLNKNLKSQTVANLHQALFQQQQEGIGAKKNQIQITKAMLKTIQMRKQSQKSSQSNSHYDGDKSSQNQQELSFNQQQQQQNIMVYPPLDQNNQMSIMMSSHPSSIKHLLDQNHLPGNDYNHMFMSEQHQELTPIIQNKGSKRNQGNQLFHHNMEMSNPNDNKYNHGIRPIDSLQSFQLGPNPISSVGQSRDDISIFKSQENFNDQQMIKVDPYYHDHRPQSSQNAQAERQLRSRSGSIEGGSTQAKQKSNKKKRSNKKQKNPVLKQQIETMQQQVQIQQPVILLSPSKSSNIADNVRQNSGSKTRKSQIGQSSQQRKGSAGYKRNNAQQQPLVQMNTIGVNNQVNLNKIKQNNTNAVARPRSANIMTKANIIEMLQQKQQQDQQEKIFHFMRHQASVTIQKNLRRFLAKKHTIQLQREKSKVERDLRLVQQKYWSQQQQQQQINDNQPRKQKSPIKQLFSESANQQVQFNNNINILDEEVKNDRNERSVTSSYDSKPSQLSRSEANLKHLIAQEQDKFKKQNRPGSSDNLKYNKNQSLIKNDSISEKSSKNATDKRSQSNSQQQQQMKQSQLQQPKRIEAVQLIDIEQEPRISRNLNDQFDSMTSLNRLSNELNFKDQSKEESSIKNQRKLEESKVQDSFLKSVEMHESFNRPLQTNSQLHKKLAAQRPKNEDNLGNFYNNSHQIHSNSQILSSDERDISWQFDRRSFQDLFDPSSQILNKESKRQSLEAVMTSEQKAVLPSNIYNQYENYMNEMQKKADLGRQELSKLSDRLYLSPASMKKKQQLQKWVERQEDELNQKKNFMKENIDEFIQKLQHEFQVPKIKQGSGRKDSVKFNVSHEISQIDMSLGHITSSSISATPRIYNANQMIQKQQEKQQNISVNNNSNQINQNSIINQSDRESVVSKPNKKLFDYKILSNKDQSQTSAVQQPSKKLSEQSLNKLVHDESKDQSVRSKIKSQIGRDSSLMDQSSRQIGTEEIKLEFNNDNEGERSNIFKSNLFEQEQKSSNTSKSFAHQAQSDKNLREQSEGVTTSNNDDGYPVDEDEGESLSKMEPPQFQSPTMSAISPNQQMKDYFSDEEEKVGPHPFQIGKFQDNNNDMSKKSKQDEFKFGGVDSDRGYKDAFMALKEPEQPITMEKAKQIIEEKEQREVQTEILTDFILGLLVEQLKMNLFPKRVIIPMKSPSKEDSFSNNESQLSQLVDSDHKNAGIEEFESQKQTTIDDQSTLNLQPQESQTKLELPPQPPKKKRVRGIKTTMRIVDQYVAQVFKKVKESEDEFVENLSTPLNKDPLEILLHLQNAVLDNEFENAVAFQQSVLPVDLYLDLERNKQSVQAVDFSDDEDAVNNRSMMGEWENIHNKVIFDGINEALDNFRPYGLRGPPMPWSQQTRTLTYKNGQQIDTVLKQVRLKVMEWARTFSGALPCSELLLEYGIKGPLDEDKLNLLREERLAQVLAAEIEENEMLWTDYEYEETQTKLDVADMILEFLAEEAARDLNKIQQSRMPQNILGDLNNDSTTMASASILASLKQ